MWIKIYVPFRVRILKADVCFVAAKLRLKYSWLFHRARFSVVSSDDRCLKFIDLSRCVRVLLWTISPLLLCVWCWVLSNLSHYSEIHDAFSLKRTSAESLTRPPTSFNIELSVFELTSISDFFVKFVKPERRFQRKQNLCFTGIHSSFTFNVFSLTLQGKNHKSSGLTQVRIFTDKILKSTYSRSRTQI